MMPEEWPIAAPAADPNVPARAAGGDRLRTVRSDFFLDPAERLTEQERALMTAMLHCLVGDIADEIRALLPNLPAVANDRGNREIIDLLLRAHLLNRAGLVRLLLRRADEERIMTAARSRAGRREARIVQGFVSHADGAVAAAAMALIIARGRRRDRFGQCLLHFDDLAPEDARVLVNAIAAALRGELAGTAANAGADRLLAGAAARLMASYDSGSSLETLTGALVRLLDEEGDLSDELILSAAVEGEINFVAHALAGRSGLSGDVALTELLSGDSDRVMALLRIGGLPRGTTAGLLAAIGDLLGLVDPAKSLARFEAMTDEEVADARNWLGADPRYRRAVEAMGKSDGERSL